MLEEDVFPTNPKQTEEKEEEILESKMENGYYVYFYNNQTNVTTHTFTLNKLKHFSQYSISVQACRDFNESTFTTHTHCSNAEILNRRTKKIGEIPKPLLFRRFFFILLSAETETADDIDMFDSRETVGTNNSKKVVKVFWPEPKDPNGLILSYTITYKSVDLDNLKPPQQCVTRLDHRRDHEGAQILALPNGNYSVWVRATSLAGEGHPSRTIYILIDVSVEKLIEGELTEDEFNEMGDFEFFRRYGYHKKMFQFYSVKP